ncbi:MAG: hypothetical protein SGI73_22335 [Chloroflexota bacterium]|nr:hypothetical protein [Chloroflexota bacterium]
MALTEELQKEAFSVAYVRAVAAAAGCELYRMETDTRSIDLGLIDRVGDNCPTPRTSTTIKMHIGAKLDATG